MTTRAAFVFAGGGSLGAVEVGMLRELVRAGISIAGRELVDGGVCSNTPIAAAVRLGATDVIVLPACRLRLRGADSASRLDRPHALSLVVARQLVQDIEHFASRVRICVVPALCPLEISSYDDDHCAALIERAADTTRSWLHGGGLRAAPNPGPLVFHPH